MPQSSCVDVVGSAGLSLYSTLPPECLACMAACAGGSERVARSPGEPERRRGILEDASGRTFLCTGDHDLVQSSKLFRKELQLNHRLISLLASAREEVARSEASKTNRLFHNLVSLNAHAIQDFYITVPQDELANSGSYKSQKDLVKRRLLADPGAAAVLFLRALKNETAVKAELSVYRKLHDPSPVLRPQFHPVHKVLLNVVNLFFQDLADNEIRISIENTQASLTVDYEALQVALYHLMDNACKYTRPSSEIHIGVTSSANRFCVIFDMQSLNVPPEDQGRIFEDEFSGKQARAIGKAGKGLGMGLVRDLLKLNKASISITWGVPGSLGSDARDGEPIYSRNSFVISFPQEIVRDPSQRADGLRR